MIDPYVLFEKAQLQADMHVADLGCGQTGQIVFPGAKIVGHKGIMYAVDIMKDVLSAIQKRAAEHGILNVHPVWADLEQVGSTAIPPKSLDIAFLINTLVQCKDRDAVLAEASRLLKQKARLVIVDWAKKGLSFGPSDDYFIDFEKIKEWGIRNGFALQEEFMMGNYHRGIILFRHE